MNSHTWANAVPPTARAEPRLRAGLTEGPGCRQGRTTLKVSPKAMAAVARFFNVSPLYSYGGPNSHR